MQTPSILVAFAVICASSTLRADLITYSLNPFPDAPAFTGSITTDGTLGALAPANILTWTYTTPVGPGGATFSGTGADVQIGGLIAATATEITITLPTDGSLISLNLLHPDGFGFTGDTLEWLADSRRPQLSLRHNGTFVSPGNTFFAVSPSSSFAIASVPEPSSAIFFGVASLGGAVVASGRRGIRS